MFINSGIKYDKENKIKYLNYFFYKNFPDCSTFDKKRAETLASKFNRLPSSIKKVSIMSVKELIIKSRKFFKNSQEIHLLNIDTEGYEINICNDFFEQKIFPWVICVEELGLTVDDMHKSPVKKILEKSNYLLASKTLLSSIYIRNDIFKKLKSPYMKDYNF